MKRILETPDEVIEALGGNEPVGTLTGRTAKAVSNWRKFETLPSNTYVALTAALKELDLSAPDSLWGMTAPVVPASPDRVTA